MTERSAASVGGVVLAAGRSRRMGRPKPLLRIGPETFLSRAVGTLRGGGCEVVVVVVGADPAAAGEADAVDAVVVENADPDAQQVESLRLGLRALPRSAAAAVVLPVDHPLVREETVAALIGRWRKAPDRIVRPVHEGRPGHPTVFPRATWADLDADLPRGARTLVEDRRHATDDVPVPDPGVVADVDTPETYARWVEGR